VAETLVLNLVTFVFLVIRCNCKIVMTKNIVNNKNIVYTKVTVDLGAR